MDGGSYRRSGAPSPGPIELKEEGRCSVWGTTPGMSLAILKHSFFLLRWHIMRQKTDVFHTHSLTLQSGGAGKKKPVHCSLLQGSIPPVQFSGHTVFVKVPDCLCLFPLINSQTEASPLRLFVDKTHSKYRKQEPYLHGEHHSVKKKY